MKLDRALLTCLVLPCASFILSGCMSMAPFSASARPASLDSHPQWRPDRGVANGVLPGETDAETARSSFDFDAGPQRFLDSLGRRPKTATLCAVTMNLMRATKEVRLRHAAERLRSDAGIMPDFILCQEVKFSGPHKQSHTAEHIAAQIGYDVRGTKRTSDGEGLAIASRYPFDYYASRQLDARTSALLLGFRRVSIMGEFEVPEVGRVRVVNVHLAYLPFEGHIRRRQLEETLQWVAHRDRQVPAVVTILGGDFNARLGSSTMSQLTSPAASGPMRFVESNDGVRGTTEGRIDHLFVASATHDVRLIHERELWSKHETSPFWRSDHLPVVKAFAISESSRLTVNSSPRLPSPRLNAAMLSRTSRELR